jgi:hypothetical protein
MILHALDQVIANKVKWILGKDLILMVKPPSQTSLNTDDQNGKIEIVEEKMDHLSLSLTRHQFEHPDLKRMETLLLKHVSILSRLLWKYAIIQDLVPWIPQETLKNYGSLVPWTKISFVKLRQVLVDLFAEQSKPLPIPTTTGVTFNTQPQDPGAFPNQPKETTKETLIATRKPWKEKRSPILPLLMTSMAAPNSPASSDSLLSPMIHTFQFK